MISYFIFQDVIDHGIDYIGGNPSDNARRDCIRAALEAYRDLANAHNWTYLYTQSRIITSAAYDSGSTGATMAYTHSGETYPRMATITGDVWPAWAGDGVVRIGLVGYKIDQRISATVVTFDEVVNPGEDIAAGTEFSLYRDTCLLPEDFIAQDQALYERNFGGMDYTHPRDWLFENRYVLAQGIPQFFTITGERKYPGRLVTRIFPWLFSGMRWCSSTETDRGSDGPSGHAHGTLPWPPSARPPSGLMAFGEESQESGLHETARSGTPAG